MTTYGGKPRQAYPKGLRMLAGNPNRRVITDSLEDQSINWGCIGMPPNKEWDFRNFQKKQWTCPLGLRAQIVFPSCWDGKNLDSADHKVSQSSAFYMLQIADLSISHTSLIPSVMKLGSVPRPTPLASKVRSFLPFL